MQDWRRCSLRVETVIGVGTSNEMPCGPLSISAWHDQMACHERKVVFLAATALVASSFYVLFVSVI